VSILLQLLTSFRHASPIAYFRAATLRQNAGLLSCKGTEHPFTVAATNETFKKVPESKRKHDH
jgi:hypothetical protein